MKILAIITARGGSKRIPRKNIKKFCGNPIIYYSIKAALESGIFEEVMVSTDDQEIADYALQCGAKVPFMRSVNTSNDYATTAEVLLEVLEEYRKRGQEFDSVCCLYPTAPFVTKEKLKFAQNEMVECNADAIIPVVAFSYPPQWSFIVNVEGNLKYKWEEHLIARSQDLEKLYHDVGQFYFIKVNTLFEEKTLVPKNTKPYFVEELQVQDIDNLNDWKLAEIKYKLMLKTKLGEEHE